MGNNNNHSVSVIARCSQGYADIRTAGYWLGVVQIPVGGYTRVIANNIAGHSGDSFGFLVDPGGICYFILPQLEEQPAATSIIPTAGATATRAATSLTYPVSGNMSSTQGTFYFECITRGAIPNFTVNVGGFGFFVDGISGSVLVGTGITAIPASFAADVTHKVAISYTTTSVRLFVDGVLMGASAYTGTPDLITLLGGCLAQIKDVRTFNRALTDAQLIAMTA